MNERIKLLALQAGYTKDMFGVGHWDMPECQKFAELIVEECTTVIDRTLFQNIGWNTSRAVRRHFGIEDEE